FVWRAKDWARNSLSIYCRQFFSAKELRGKKTQEQHEMLHAIGKNWTDLPSRYRNGLLWLPVGATTHVLPSYESLNSRLGDLV
ncbi:MAG: tRNA(His) guanylyltransferase Thg1 family protein, partial [Candidatus Thorarchaeota archaeon]